MIDYHKKEMESTLKAFTAEKEKEMPDQKKMRMLARRYAKQKAMYDLNVQLAKKEKESEERFKDYLYYNNFKNHEDPLN